MAHQTHHPSIMLEGMAPLLEVFDMPTSLHFYRDILSFEVTQRSGEGDDVDWVLLKHSRIELMLNTAYEKPYRPVAPDPQRVKAHFDTAIYFGCPDIDQAYSHLISKRLDVKPPEITGYGWKALNFFDPDGYRICFHYPVKG